ncbi:MAG: hypothetical protein P8Y23_11885 [Candidatus Lokiarchaeota archaeon]
MIFRKYLWIFNIIGGLLSIISIMTPSSYNDTTSTLYYVWMTQIGVDIDPLAIYLLREDITLVLISWIVIFIIFSSSLVTITLTGVYIRASLNRKKLNWKLLIMVGLIIISTLFWIFMMESFYNLYGFHHWITTGGGYSPYFGIVGPFIGAFLIVIGAFSKRK